MYDGVDEWVEWTLLSLVNSFNVGNHQKVHILQDFVSGHTILLKLFNMASSMHTISAYAQDIRIQRLVL